MGTRFNKIGIVMKSLVANTLAWLQTKDSGGEKIEKQVNNSNLPIKLNLVRLDNKKGNIKIDKEWK